MVKRRLGAAAVFGMMLLAGPTSAGQTSELAASEATEFIGTWIVTLDGPRGGNVSLTVTVRDEGGMVAARIEGGRGGPSDVTEVTRSGDDLVLAFEREGRRGRMEIAMTLTLTGDDTVDASMSLGGGQFTIEGAGERQ